MDHIALSGQKGILFVKCEKNKNSTEQVILAHRMKSVNCILLTSRIFENAIGVSIIAIWAIRLHFFCF